jgi:hypothetical protein
MFAPLTAAQRTRHVALLAVCCLTLVAWVLIRDETAKLLVGLLTFVLAIAAAYVAFRTATLGWRKPWLAMLAALVCIGSCAQQAAWTRRDDARILAQLDALDCSDVREIWRTGRGLDREWTRRSDRLTSPTNWTGAIALELLPLDGATRFSVQPTTWMNDNVRVFLECGAPAPSLESAPAKI